MPEARPAPVLAVVWEKGAAGPGEVIRAAASHCEVVFVADRSTTQAATYSLMEALGTTLDLGVLTVPQTAQRLRAAGATHIMTFSDIMLPVTAALAQAAGLPYHDADTIVRLTDKAAQRQALRRAGLPSPTAHRVTSADAAVDLLGELHGPVIVKPVTGSGGRNTFTATDAEETLRLLEQILTDTPGQEFVVEELLVGDPRAAGPDWGDYVSVECFSDDGTATAACVNGKFPLLPPFREQGNVHPPTIGADLMAEAVAAATAAADALGVRTGATHTEVKLTPNGPVIIEVNGRLGGYVAPAVEQATGVNLVETAVRNTLGLPWEPVPPAPRVGYTYHCVLPQEATAYRGVRGDLAAARRVPGVAGVGVDMIPAGTPVSWLDGMHAQYGTVLGHAPDHENVRATVAHVKELLDVAYDRR